ncbi:hypothetical protein FC99_GL001116 [Levilactobacillus koreensis JCM 16448]|uniref:Extracellular protein n=1 Tax=Levilactobacillus koreensis TaxID=637971 RepID=A0AAC8UV78_9LACO|nr:hypothetical protein [Levilactobacillus koreensis]AKP64508.1 hypothetical protein ABN16_05540 [Levilactobacillus koreensis]KRK91960.1 hypothetical protein FC99_GL001116 [Levilactobacillus koreensis JCM 16448]
MKKRARGISGLLIGLVAGGLLFAQTPRNQSTVTDSVVQPTSGQTMVKLSSQTGKGHVQIKTQKTTSQAGKTVSRQTTTTAATQQENQHGMNK